MRFEARDLSVGRGEEPLLRGLDLTLEDHDRVALVGPSGSGKTTALRGLALLDRTLRGTLTLDGLAPTAMGVPAWRRRVLYVAQRAAFFGGTVEEELARPFLYASAGAASFDAAEAEATLARLHLPGALARPVSELSEGEQQRVALTRALLARPAVLLLDEPTSALDAEARDAVDVELERVAFVLVTHDTAWREQLGAVPLDVEALRG